MDMTFRYHSSAVHSFKKQGEKKKKKNPHTTTTYRDLTQDQSKASVINSPIYCSLKPYQKLSLWKDGCQKAILKEGKQREKTGDAKHTRSGLKISASGSYGIMNSNFSQ